MDLTSITPSPSQLKALTHPVRVRILGLLRADGPATATTLAQRLGLNTGATSYHLRQLAQHGFVVDDPELGTGRDRWWKAAHQSTRTRAEEPRGAEERETMEAYIQSVVTVMTEQLQHAVEELPLLPDDWRDAVTFSDWAVTVTPARARALVQALAGTFDDVVEDDADDPGAASFVIQINAYPRPGTVAGAGLEGELR
jgi:predicted ArsR family transcriptional regulator